MANVKCKSGSTIDPNLEPSYFEPRFATVRSLPRLKFPVSFARTSCPFEIGDAFQKPFGLIARNGFDGSSVMLEQHRSIFQGAVRKRCALEFAAFVNARLIIGHKSSLCSRICDSIRHVAYVKQIRRLLNSKL
jgi:hypothetical protein